MSDGYPAFPAPLIWEIHPVLVFKRLKMSVHFRKRFLVPFIQFGLILTGIGSQQCIKGYDYRVAAKHEMTTVGHIVYVPAGRGSYKYEFWVDGVKMVDSARLCTTPLMPDACKHYGPVLVYYSYQPYSNSLLQDFSIACNFPIQVGKLLLAIGLPLLIFPSVILAVLMYRSSRGNGSYANAIHIVPGE
jgi:hypothetical protein